MARMSENEQISSGERQSARWESVVGDDHDRYDVGRLLGMENYKATIGDGMILRRGERPIGLIRFSTEYEGPDKILTILALHVKPDERSPGVASKLIWAIKNYGEERGFPSSVPGNSSKAIG